MFTVNTGSLSSLKQSLEPLEPQLSDKEVEARITEAS